MFLKSTTPKSFTIEYVDSPAGLARQGVTCARSDIEAGAIGYLIEIDNNCGLGISFLGCRLHVIYIYILGGSWLLFLFPIIIHRRCVVRGLFCYLIN